MKRRTFLKGLLGTTAVVTAGAALVKDEPELSIWRDKTAVARAHAKQLEYAMMYGMSFVKFESTFGELIIKTPNPYDCILEYKGPKAGWA